MNAKSALGTIRYWVWASWPALPMALATVAGFALGMVALYIIRPPSELIANLIVGAGVVFVQAVAFAGLVLTGRAVVPRVLVIAVWAVGLIAAAVLLVIL